MEAHHEDCTSMFLDALNTVVSKRNWPTCPSVDQWVEKHEAVAKTPDSENLLSCGGPTF